MLINWKYFRIVAENLIEWNFLTMVIVGNSIISHFSDENIINYLTHLKNICYLLSNYSLLDSFSTTLFSWSCYNTYLNIYQKRIGTFISCATNRQKYKKKKAEMLKVWSPKNICVKPKILYQNTFHFPNFMLHEIHVTFHEKCVFILAIVTKCNWNIFLNFVAEIIAYTCQIRYRKWMKWINML